MTKFVPYLQNQISKILGVNLSEKPPVDLSLNMLAIAHRERSDSSAQMAPQGAISDMAYHYADILIDGGVVAFYDATTARTYYAVEVEGAIVAVYYTMGPFFNIHTAICSMPEILVKLGVTTYQFQDLAIIDKIFGFNKPATVIVIEPSPTSTVPPELPVVEWFTPPARAVKVEEDEVAVAETPSTAIPGARIITEVHHLEVKEDAPVSAQVPDPAVSNQMQQAFQRANGTDNTTRNSNRRRDHTHRHGTAAERTTATA